MKLHFDKIFYQEILSIHGNFDTIIPFDVTGNKFGLKRISQNSSIFTIYEGEKKVE